jgi:hypothetical protein
MLLATLQSASFFLFTMSFTRRILSKKVQIFFLVATIAIALLTLTNGVFSHSEVVNGMELPKPNYGIILFACYALGSVMMSILLLIMNLWNADKVERIRTQFILTGFAITMFTIVATNFFGVVLFRTTNFAPLGLVSTLFFVGCSAYAMTRYRFLSVRAILRKTVVYSFFVTVFTCLYISIVFLLYFFFIQRDSNTDLLLFSIVASMPYIPFLQFAGKKMKRLLEVKSVGSKIDLTRYINDEDMTFNSTHEIESYVLKMCGSIQEEIKAPVLRFFILQRQSKRYRSFFPAKPQASIYLDSFDQERIINLDRPTSIKELNDTSEAAQLKKILKKHQARIYLPIILNDTLIAMIFIGKHKNNIDFESENIEKLKKFQKDGCRAIPALLEWQISVESTQNILKNRM